MLRVCPIASKINREWPARSPSIAVCFPSPQFLPFFFRATSFDRERTVGSLWELLIPLKLLFSRLFRLGFVACIDNTRQTWMCRRETICETINLVYERMQQQWRIPLLKYYCLRFVQVWGSMEQKTPESMMIDCSEFSPHEPPKAPNQTIVQLFRFGAVWTKNSETRFAASISG